MPGPRRLLDIPWYQVVASVLAAVTAAWLASRLGVAGTVVGAALGSFVVTISTALYGRTLDRTTTLLVQTASGTVIQKAVRDGEIAEAVEEAAEVDDSPVRRAEVVRDGPRRLHWRTIVVTTVVVLALALAAISAYELATGRTLDGSDGTTIGDTFGGSRGGSDAPAPSPEPTEPAPTSSTATPTPEPTASTPEPSASTPTPTPTPTPTEAPE